MLIIYSKVTRGVGVPCPIKDITGMYCFGCGGTRMMEALLHFNLYKAFRYNSLLLISLPILISIYVVQSYLFIIKNKIISWIDKFAFTYILCLGLFMVLRNMEMFKWLAPVMGR